MIHNTAYNETDKHFLSLALTEAKLALEAGDYPVGAVLTCNGSLLDQDRNSLFTDKHWTAHAEHNLISRNSSYLLKKFRSGDAYDVCLYTSLEPCLMCLGIAIMHRVSRIVFACPDPHGGTTRLEHESLGSFYQDVWPNIQTGLFREEACDLILEFLKTKRFISWEEMLAAFEEMKRGWR